MLDYCDFLRLFTSKSKFFFVGIGGVSMSSLAVISKNAGIDVSGYDSADNESVDRLKSKGIPVYKEFDEKEFDGVDLVIFTGAIKESSDFIKYPREKGIPIIKRGPFLGFLMKKYGNTIGISGTHGKSTTTGMISSVFMEAKREPSVLIGAEIPDFPEKTFRSGNGDDFIFEACEYQDSFLSFFPKIAVILNVAFDHADYFPNLEAVEESFTKFANIAKDGFAVINKDDEGAMNVAAKTVSKVIFFSEKEKADVYAENITSDMGCYSFTAVIDGEEKGRISLAVPGRHNVSNALSAIAVAHLSGIPFSDTKKGLENYCGVKRRFEYRGTCGKMKVYDDYAHHPDEIRATLKSAREMTDKPITVIFQSHTYSRTKAYYNDFISSLSIADEVIFADIYPARELPIEGIDGQHLAASSKNGKYVGNFEKIAEYAKNLDKDGLLIVMGAGTVVNITPMIIDK